MRFSSVNLFGAVCGSGLAFLVSGCGESAFVRDCVRAHETDRANTGLDPQSIKNLCEAEAGLDHSETDGEFPTGVTSGDIEHSITRQAQRQYGVRPRDVSCSDVVQVQVDESLRCRIELGNGESADVTARLSQINPERVIVE